MSIFITLLEKYKKKAFSKRDQGDRFELLIQRYLKTDPKYANLLSEVWLWDDFPYKADISDNDTGIDLVAKTNTDEYWAIQCKFYSDDSQISKKDVDTFLSTSSHSFDDDKVFSQRIWISTTNNWNTTAEQTLQNQNPPVVRINLTDLENAPIKWKDLDKGLFGEQARNSKKQLRAHQREALENTNHYFKNKDRGKLIMACGTGKTYTSLKIAENETEHSGLILFLVPSIALLGQTLNEWTAESQESIHPICICSDSGITKKSSKNNDDNLTSVIDLAMPASTNIESIVMQLNNAKKNTNKGMTVVFSTYQSIKVIANAQKEYLRENNTHIFDLIICDEAHRTTGFSEKKGEESHFIKVHDNDFLKAKKRLYMTATPRLYDDNSKTKAAQSEAILCSMDDEKIYGEEIYRIGFGKAVEQGLLTDYKVLILSIEESQIPKAFQEAIADENDEINTDDASKLIGCINALSKQIIGDNQTLKKADPSPMKRAVAFCQTIKASQGITQQFNSKTPLYRDTLTQGKKEQIIPIASKHIDGTMNAPKRAELLNWLKSENEETKENECKILTNARCLSEGVDVPNLDAVMFLSAKNSQIDVVQSVGRVMRLAKGKKYGYIIIPILIPSGVKPEVALNDNTKYKTVWSVLQALRAHDDRFSATINQIDLNKKKPNSIVVGGVGFDSDGSSGAEGSQESQNNTGIQTSLNFEELQSTIYAKMVQKVGERTYWEQWAQDVSQIATQQLEKLQRITKEDKHKEAFENFIKGLQNNINPTIDNNQAIEMLSQHLITKPVFEALFDEYSFSDNNTISVAMQGILDTLKSEALDKDTQTLNKFYESVKKRASGIDNAQGKQKIIIELYDKFFRTAFPKMVEQLGIVYTPVEVVDFIIHSVNDVLKTEFDRSLSDENIHILDPFTGTGTFMTRLLQSGLILPKDLERKYKHELHANEIVLLAYYIAAINIENAYHDLKKENEKTQKINFDNFNGVCLTDTFQLGEDNQNNNLGFKELFAKNSKQVENQKKAPLRVIIGNPPYSIGQKSANDNAQNQKYTILDSRIEQTYVKESNAGLNKSLYDAYIKAFRWSTDRLDENGGVIAFVSNGAWLDGNSTSGFRKSIQKEFSSIYVFNLRGNQRTSGELSRKEGGKIFGSGARTPIAITILVKNPNITIDKAQIHYHDIGDYLDQKTKLQTIQAFKGIQNLPFVDVKPNKEGDWINKRNTLFDTYIPIQPEKKFKQGQSWFFTNAIGVATNRDNWVQNFSQNEIKTNMTRFIDFYNTQRKDFAEQIKTKPDITVEKFINKDPKNISWSVNLKKSLYKKENYKYQHNENRIGLYRPFQKQHIYFDKPFIERPGLSSKLFPTPEHKNLVIAVTGNGSSKDFSALISDKIVNLDTIEKSQCFPLYWYEEQGLAEKGKETQSSLFEEENTTKDRYIRRDAVSDFILKRAKQAYGTDKISREDIFYYVYGLLHNKEYKATFANDLKKMLPKMPLVEGVAQFYEFSNAGRKLAELHLNYETLEHLDTVKVEGSEDFGYEVQKMKFIKKGKKDTIIYNTNIRITNIPLKAYEYIVNGKSAIEWIMERYQKTTHKDSGITNDPNDWAKEHNHPRYILDLLLSVIALSVKSVDIIERLPKLSFEIEAND